MSSEPRFQLIDGGSAVGEWYQDANNDIILVDHNNTSEVAIKDIATTSAGSGVLFGYLSTTQNGIDGGVYANVFETTPVHDTNIYTVDSSSQITIDVDGLYKIDWQANFHQTSGDARAIVAGEVAINGTNQTDQSLSRCYIRLSSGNGDMNHVDAESYFNLVAGDTIQVYVYQDHGATGHDLTHARAGIEKVN